MAYGSVELVVAVTENDVIGRDGQLPWRLPADLRHFKALTVRKTHESIGRALPQRTNLVLSRSSDFAAADCIKVATIDEAQQHAGHSPLMVIGGAQIYRICLPVARRIHLTLVHAEIVDGDTFFADWRDPMWRESSRERHEPDANNEHAYSFITLDRIAD